jgi:phosphoribosylformylglycinamidine synthase
VVLQVRTAERNAVMQVLRAHGLSRTATSSARRGRPRPAWPRARAAQVWRDAKEVFSASLRPAPGLGRVSWKIAQQRDNPACADAEHAAAGDPADPGLSVVLSEDLKRNMALAGSEYAKAAILM